MHKIHSIIAVALLSGSTLSAYIIIKILQNMKQGDFAALKWYIAHWYRRIRAQTHIFSIIFGFLGGLLVYRVAVRHGGRLLGAANGEYSPYGVGKKYLITQNIHLIRSKQKIQQELERVMRENKELTATGPPSGAVSMKRIKKKDASVQTQTALRRAYERVLEKVKIPGVLAEETHPEDPTGVQHAVAPYHHSTQQHHRTQPAGVIELHATQHQSSDSAILHQRAQHALPQNVSKDTHRWIQLGMPRNILSSTTGSVRRYWDSSVGRVGSLFGGNAAETNR